MLQNLIERGASALDRGAFAEALLYFRKVLAEQPRFADVRNHAGVCLALLGRADEAVDEFSEALSINPDYRDAALHRALVLTELGRYEEARADFETVHRLDQRDDRALPGSAGDRIAAAHADLGDLYRAAGEPDRAGEEYRKALGLRPSFLDIRSRLGETYVALAQLPEARAELEEILARNPSLTGVRLQLGVVLRRMGDTDGARREWTRCAEEDPDDLRAKAYLASVTTMSMAAREGDG